MEVIVRSKVTGFLQRITRCVVIILFVANLSAHLGTQKCTWICPMMESEKKIGNREIGNRVAERSFAILYNQGSIFPSALLLLCVLS